MISMASQSLYQDALGLERYVAHVREHWVDAVYTIPIAIVLMLAGTGGYVLAKLREPERRGGGTVAPDFSHGPT